MVQNWNWKVVEYFYKKPKKLFMSSALKILAYIGFSETGVKVAWRYITDAACLTWKKKFFLYKKELLHATYTSENN